MRLSRALSLSILMTVGSVIALTGCSGKPENSPVIRKKFAEYDKVAEANTALSADVTRLNEEVARLTQENSELRALLPSVDGQSVVTKLSTLEARLAKVEGVAGDRVLAAATTTTKAPEAAAAAATTTTDSASPLLDAAPLAVAPAPKVEDGANVVAAQQAAPPTFKEMTNPAKRNATVPAQKTSNATKRTEAKKPETKKAETAKKAEPKKATTAAAPARRGSYHTFAPGETLAAVAAKYGTTTKAILSANRLPEGARIGTGQRLYIPGSK